jgi:ABC-type antimicrobial peptide transport system permease subunit
MILRQGLTLAVSGVAVGVAAAFLLTRLMQSLLYEVQPADPVTFLAVPVILLAVSLVASYVPALRATRVSPLIALRTQ